MNALIASKTYEEEQSKISSDSLFTIPSFLSVQRHFLFESNVVAYSNRRSNPGEFDTRYNSYSRTIFISNLVYSH